MPLLCFPSHVPGRRGLWGEFIAGANSEEKFTIRVVAPRNDDAQLQKFVGRYSFVNQ